LENDKPSKVITVGHDPKKQKVLSCIPHSSEVARGAMGDAPEELPWGLDAKKLQKVGWRAGSLCSASSPPARASSVPSAMLRARISAASGVGARWPARRGLRLTGGCFGSLQGSKAQLTSDKIKGFQIGTQVGGGCARARPNGRRAQNGCSRGARAQC
jgi:hypothetical protein